VLREYVREVLVEFEGGGGDGGDYGDLYAISAGMNPYGANFGSYGDLYNVFVKPFADVFDTAAGKVKELSQKAQTLAKVTFETVASTLIPTYAGAYKEIFAKEKEKMDKIKEEYKEVYQSNIDAFMDNDVFWTAFCYAPAALLTVSLIRHSPGKARKMISALSGGSLDPWLDRAFAKYHVGPPISGLNYKGSETSMGGGGGGYGYADFGGYGGGDHGGGDSGGVSLEGFIREKDEKSAPKPDIDGLAKLLTDHRVVEKLEQSSVTKGLERESQGTVRSTLKEIFQQAQAVLHAKSLQELQHKTGKQVKGAEKLAQLQPQERQKTEQAILATVRKSLKEFYVSNLEEQVKKAQQAGVPSNSPYVQDYNHAISKIKAL